LVGEARINRQDFQVSWNGHLENGGVVVSDEVSSRWTGSLSPCLAGGQNSPEADAHKSVGACGARCTQYLDLGMRVLARGGPPRRRRLRDWQSADLPLVSRLVLRLAILAQRPYVSTSGPRASASFAKDAIGESRRLARSREGASCGAMLQFHAEADHDAVAPYPATLVTRVGVSVLSALANSASQRRSR
jgi:hypothetical protein